MNIIAWQVITLLIMFWTILFFFFFPCCWVNHHPEIFQNPEYLVMLSLANCFSGGVFVATFFVGLLPEVREKFGEIMKKEHSKFPITEIIVFLGFFISLLVEQLALEYQSRLKCRKKKDCEESSEELSKEEVANHGHSHGNVEQFLSGTNNGVRFMMLILSMGVHSLFEGLALGLQDNVTSLINLFIGVILHESLVAFAMGVNVARQKLCSKVNTYVAIIFSGTIPFGQLLGLLFLYHQSKQSLIVSATLQALAAGTFIHVTFLEVIPSEFRDAKHRLLKVAFILIGFITLTACNTVMQVVIASTEDMNTVK